MAKKDTTSWKMYPEYKDSGIEWIGQIPDHWHIKKVSHLFPRLGSGTTPPSGDTTLYKNGSINWLQTGDLNDSTIIRTSKKITERTLLKFPALTIYSIDSIVMAMYGATIGKLGILQITSATNQACCVFPESKHVIPKYWFYKLLGTRNHIISLGYGGGQPNISQYLIKTLRFPIASKQEQFSIVTFLDEKTAKIDQAIKQKEQMISLLQERKQILIQNAVTKGLDPNVPMKDSGIDWIGEIPAHWDMRFNRTLFREKKQPGHPDLPILSVSIHSGVSDAELDDDANIRGKVRIEDKTSYKSVFPGDITYNMMRAWQGGIGSVKILGMVSPAYVVATPITDAIDPRYFEAQYRLPLFIEEMNKASKGITDFRKRLYWQEFKGLATIVPPIREQENIASFIEDVSTKFERSYSQITSQISRLKEYKSILIDSAVTGKIDVSDYSPS